MKHLSHQPFFAFFSALILLWSLLVSAAWSAPQLMEQAPQHSERMVECGDHVQSGQAAGKHCQDEHCHCLTVGQLPALILPALLADAVQLSLSVPAHGSPRVLTVVTTPPYRPPAA